jgi:hypothetical protein
VATYNIRAELERKKQKNESSSTLKHKGEENIPLIDALSSVQIAPSGFRTQTEKL